jgi:hypothetical protein
MGKHGLSKLSAPLTLLPRLIDIIVFQRLQDMANVDFRDAGVFFIISVFVVLAAPFIT